MKRLKDLTNGFASVIWCYEVIGKAAKGKGKRRDVKHVVENQIAYAYKLCGMLWNEEYEPTPWQTSIRKDGRSGKEREISQVPFWPDQCVHWALVESLKPAIMRGMHPHSCGNIPGRGQHHGIRYVKKVLRCHPKRRTRYALQMDVSKFYGSIDQDKLLAMLARKVKDGKALRLAEKVVRSYPEGMPIGSYVSQWLANFYLESLDHHISEDLGARYYVRFVDDMVIIGPNKRKLHSIRRKVDAYLAGIGLKLKPNWQVYQVDRRGIDFLGYVFKHGVTRMRGRNFLHLRHQLAKVGKAVGLHRPIHRHLARSTSAMLGQRKWWDSLMFSSLYVQPGTRRILKKVMV